MAEKDRAMNILDKYSTKKVVIVLIVLCTVLIGVIIGGTIYGVTRITKESVKQEPRRINVTTSVEIDKKRVVGNNGKKFRPKNKGKQRLSTKT